MSGYAKRNKDYALLPLVDVSLSTLQRGIEKEAVERCAAIVEKATVLLPLIASFKVNDAQLATMLNIEKYFEEIFIVDPTVSILTKKEIFQNILKEKNYKAEEVIIIGDDIKSEIKAGQELGIESILYDREGKCNQEKSIRSFRELADKLK